MSIKFEMSGSPLSEKPQEVSQLKLSAREQQIILFGVKDATHVYVAKTPHGDVVGGVYVIPRESEPYAVEIMYIVRSEYANQGVATEMVQRVIQPLFIQGIKRIVAQVIKNSPSHKVLLKNNFQEFAYVDSQRVTLELRAQETSR